MTDDERGLSRASFLRAGLVAAASVPLIAGAALPERAQASDGLLELTPTCDDGDDPTPPQMEGPYFKPNSPERSSLIQGVTGTRLVLTGFVFSRRCTPVARALLDFWQADRNGNYDNVGYRLRGHQFTDAQGRFTLTTIVPGLYPGRTRHIHVKVQAPNQPILTTQLYFPGEPRNNTDPIFDPRLLMTVQNGPNGRTATFDFVLNVPGAE
ncbi:Protocatechuate 3,4-dioxygenase beta subunit [Streptoalloteichus tenebrarius]|uniref:Protocatechuate 3,4-dioxygenase beta subunit n=1 Tax=Streptoalloteichus tenebrarius (strain ATCC 17920 / DSM 40477 / JCM 4838 / CBS 697.72 / NBRC 16177 / NCIMB 11028 / NRRL B-12390 / A12253. 1 / ISP 5477) TaxID=1933 RepID=A0ABT1HUB3_STRSD|nr:dioxygenase [Streptoalloteichus tenebrarius]MCP2259088.1 Protocatechuate 3,4-dioxygenase beta subunit [Streptoalloteichus tenebrarius]BFE99586.1 dioxygenase [Streptoalloteichus tenebrarius]